jgi:hypothetical protein
MAYIENWTEYIKNAIGRYAVVLKETNAFIGGYKVQCKTGKRHHTFMK